MCHDSIFVTPLRGHGSLPVLHGSTSVAVFAGLDTGVWRRKQEEATTLCAHALLLRCML
jgi:hypothetical protein